MMTQKIIRIALRWLATILFVGAGIQHFRNAEFYRSIVPAGFPKPGWLVVISGIFEIVGGVGLQIKPLRPTARWGLIALLIAVFPANIFMAMQPQQTAPNILPLLLWIRLPIQPLLIWLVWWAGKEN